MLIEVILNIITQKYDLTSSIISKTQYLYQSFVFFYTNF